MTEVIAALIMPIAVMFVLIILAERIFAMFIRVAGFIEGLNRQ